MLNLITQISGLHRLTVVILYFVFVKLITQISGLQQFGCFH
jgi:hypothetical protein